MRIADNDKIHFISFAVINPIALTAGRFADNDYYAGERPLKIIKLDTLKQSGLVKTNCNKKDGLIVEAVII